MKKRITKDTSERRISRRELVGGALAAAGVIAGVPAFLRGQNLNNMMNIALIACGAEMAKPIRFGHFGGAALNQGKLRWLGTATHGYVRVPCRTPFPLEGAT